MSKSINLAILKFGYNREDGSQEVAGYAFEACRSENAAKHLQDLNGCEDGEQVAVITVDEEAFWVVIRAQNRQRETWDQANSAQWPLRCTWRQNGKTRRDRKRAVQNQLSHREFLWRRSKRASKRLDKALKVFSGLIGHNVGRVS